jgi:glycosyltransferase involved in cell wall biosynthesis
MSLRYVVITPARNEAEYIEMTARSLVRQTVLPLRWIVVSDGSTDDTDAIVRRYMQGRDWIELVRLPERRDRNFAAKVNAFDAGYERVVGLTFDIVANVDADISFGEDFFEFLLGKFESIPRLGVAGTHYVEGRFHSYRDSYIDVHHVNGQCQLFRRACFEQIGGYVPIRGGGIDWVAVTTARMKGWTTYSFGERTFIHHRKMGTAGGGELSARFHYGRKDYFLGGHPSWELLRGIFQMAKPPYVLGGTCLLLGYFWCWLTRHERAVTLELMRFHRGEQLARMRQLLPNLLARERQSS